METTQTSSVRSTELARKMYELRQKKAALEAQVKEIDAGLDQVRFELTTIMVELEMQKFQLEGIGTFYLSTNIYPKIPNQETMIAWLDKEGLAALAPRKVHVPSLKEMIEERMEKDLPVPGPELVEMTPETSVRLRASKKENTNV